ncbi:TPA: hypothetical protein ACH3X2_010179 [Trebouxia sp. C0005]
MLRGSSGYRQATSTSALANVDKLCSGASRHLTRGLYKCYKHNQVPAQATANLSQCVEHYEPQLAALSAKLQACSADRDAVEGSRAKLDAAFRQISVARKIKFENNIAEFSGTALGQIIKAVQGGQVEPMVIDLCGDSALCSPLAGVLQDFTKDLLQLLAHREASKQEAIQDAVAKTAEETRKAAAQAESADKEKTEWMQKNLFLSQEKAEWMQKNQKLQSQLHATNLRELAALRSTTQLKRDLSAAKRHASDSARDVSVTQQHAEQHAAELKEFVGDSKQRAEGADALQQLSVTLKSQLTAETERALSSEARVFTLDLHLAESRAEVDKLTAQVAKLEEDQDFKVELADEKARHLATVQVAAELKSQLQAARKQLTDEKQAHLVMRQASDVTESQLVDTQQQLSDEQQAHAAAAQNAAVLRIDLQEAQRAASDFQSQLQLVNEGLAAQKHCFEDANRKAASLQARLQEVKDKLAAEQQACVSAKDTLDSLQVERAAAQQSAACLQAKLAAADEALAAEKIAHHSAVTSSKADLGVAGQGTSDLISQLKAFESELTTGKQALEAVNQNAASFPAQLKATQLQAAGTRTQEEENWSVPSYQTPVKGAQQTVSSLCNQLEAVQQRVAEKIANETVHRTVSVNMQQGHQAGGHTAADLHIQWPIQLDYHTQCSQKGARGKWAEGEAGRAGFCRSIGSCRTPRGRSRASGGRGSPTPPFPTAGRVAWVQEVSRLQARHGTPTAPLQQDTNALLDKHGVQLEIQELQQELQDTKAALHLSKDRLQKAHATIDCLRKEEEASWQQMNRRHEELLEQIKILKARLSRMGALDEDAMRNDIQDYKSCPEVFDRYGNPVRVAESVRAMWPCGLPPPTDPRLVKSVVKLNMPPEELAFHVPRYGLVTTANCKQLMLLLEDRHGEAGVDNQDLGLTLLRAAQSVWVAASLIPWAQYNADLTVLGMSGRPVMSPADQRRCFTVISRESLEDPAPHFSRYLAGMMAESKQGDFLRLGIKGETQDKVCFVCGAPWDGDTDDNGEPVEVQLHVVNLHCPTCTTHRKAGQQDAGDYALCVSCAQIQARVGRCPRTDGYIHELPVTRRTPQFFLTDAANAPPVKKS